MRVAVASHTPAARLRRASPAPRCRRHAPRRVVASASMDAHTARLAAPDDVAASQLQAWLMDPGSSERPGADPRQPHRRSPDERVTPAQLAQLGVVSWHLPPGTPHSAERLAAVRAARGYTYSDEVTISRKVTPDYEAKLAIFFTEHIHADEEVRYVTQGGGYFDVRREADGAWVRVHTRAGDMIVLPAGLYHRFTLDDGDFVVAQRLFVGDPVWTPINRGPQADGHPARAQYLQAVKMAS